MLTSEKSNLILHLRFLHLVLGDALAVMGRVRVGFLTSAFVVATRTVHLLYCFGVPAMHLIYLFLAEVVLRTLQAESSGFLRSCCK